MKILRLALTAAMFSGALPGLAQQGVPTALEPPPLKVESLQIYHSFLVAYNNGSKAMLNIANVTDSFDPSDDDRSSCLKGFPVTHTSVVHHFSQDTFNDLKVHIVDPRLNQKRDPWDAIRKGEPVDDAVEAGFRAGIFTFSEIVFNAAHDRAAFTYSFVCGGLCGHGGTIIFHEQEGKWKRERDRCGSWVS